MRALRTSVLLALTVGALSVMARGAKPHHGARVGPLRAFNRFVFQGNASFSARSLWSALSSASDFPEHSHPLAPRDQFLAAFGSQLRLGYKHCGFPDAHVAAHYDSKSDRVMVEISEGPRYRCGPVQVIGARNMPVQPIVEALTGTPAGNGTRAQPFQFLDHAPANRETVAGADEVNPQGFVWDAGQPAHFDELTLHALADRVRNALKQHGFLLSQFHLNVATNAQARTATLQVNLHEEGPAATIHRINVIGNWSNSRQTLLDYLDLKPGMKFTSDLTATINDRLYHSARFLTNSVLIGAPDTAGRVNLTLNVVENDKCPPLNARFRPKEQTLLKARDWLAKIGIGRQDAVLTVSGYPDEASVIQLILAPRRGLLLLQNELVSGTNRLRHALILSANQVALYAPERRQKYVARDSQEQLKIRLNLDTSAPDKNGDCTHLSFGAGMAHLHDSSNAPPCIFGLSLAPAAFVRLAHITNSVCRLAGNELVIRNADSVLKLDARTGRFIEYTRKQEKPRRAQMSLRFRPDVFGPAVQRLEQDGAGFANLYRPKDPVGSAIAVFGSELVQSRFVEPFLRARLPAVTCAALPGLLRQLGKSNLFLAFKELMNSLTPPSGPCGKFVIPEMRRPTPSATVTSWLVAGAHDVLADCDELLPVGSWPWTLMRDVAFLFNGRRQYLLPDLAEIEHSPATGPLGCLATATAFEFLHAPAARATAARGLKRLSTADFDRDCRLFLDEHKFCGRIMASLAGTLGHLGGPELEGLLAPLPSAPATFLRDCARRMRAAPRGQPLYQTLAPALNTYWQTALKRQISEQLRMIINK